MTAWVVDASVAVKWLLPEVHSGAARKWLDADATLLAPELLYTEAANVFWKRVVRNEMTGAEAQTCLAALAGLPLRAAPTQSLLPAALEIACYTRQTVYDALYIALRKPMTPCSSRPIDACSTPSARRRSPSASPGLRPDLDTGYKVGPHGASGDY